MSVSKRWAPWWAVALTCVSLLVPLVVLVLGLQQLRYGMSDRYMAELSAAIAPVVIAFGVVLLVPGVLYLVLRRKLLFVVTMVLTVGALLTPWLVNVL